MRLTDHRRAELHRVLPPAAATREKLAIYMRSFDLPIGQFAHFLDYSDTSLRAFINDRYEKQNGSSDLAIREAIEAYMTAFPVGVRTATTAKLYETENVEQMRYWFSECLDNGYMAVVYGPPGSQKTFVAEHLIAEVNLREMHREGSRDRAYLVRCSIGIRPRDIMAKICHELGVPAGGTLQRCLTSIRMGIRNRRVLLVIDEGQLAGIPALEALRELYDMDNVGLLLLGSHTLKQTFDTRAAELEQFNSRIEDMVELTGVTERSARAILTAELPSLTASQAQLAIANSFVPDIYSRTKGKTYCSVRRLFKSIAAFREIVVAETTKESIK